MATNPPSSALHRPLIRIRIEKRRSNQARALWWWSRHGTWSTPRDEDVDDRVQKYQRIMKYRYSRALKRKAMWERENSPPIWFDRGPSKWFSSAWERKYISTTDDLRARLKDDDPSIQRNDQHWDKAHRDFEAFKAEVDRAIAKDPVGFLFGRRLQGPLSANNSSWTSFARMFDSKESQDSFEAENGPRNNPKRIKIENLDTKPRPKETALKPESLNKPAGAQQPLVPEPSYVFDPVSGRNVPQHSNETETPKSFTERVFDSLFSEHVTAQDKPSQSAKSVAKVSDKSKFENSRDYNYRQLRSNSIGTNIDTTAEFGGKYHAQTESESSRLHDDPDNSSETPDDAPPFTGTTYERSHGSPLNRLSSNRSWLEQEGFRVNTQADITANQNDKLQPSFDRMQSDKQAIPKKYTTKLQPSIERINISKPKTDVKPHTPPLQVVPSAYTSTFKHFKTGSVDDQREDLDLLRPSDVRAATKVVRTTRAQQAIHKEAARNKLEADFVRRVTNTSNLGGDQSSTLHQPLQFMKSVDGNISRSVPKHPDETMAKTFRPVGVSDVEVKLSSILNSENSRQTAKHRTDDTVLAKALPTSKTTVTPSGMTPDTPSRGVISSQEPYENLVRTLSERHQALVAADAKKVTDLAKDLREAYESERGLIDREVDRALKPADKPVEVAKTTSPLKTATVKPGVRRYPSIERYTQVFEPKLIAMRERAKDVRKNLENIRATLDEIELKKAKAPSIASTDKIHIAISQQKQSSDHSVYNISTQKLASDEKQRLSAMRALNDRIKREPQLLEKPVLRPQRSSQPEVDYKAGTPTSSSMQKQPPGVPSSPYVLLTYSKSSGNVDMTELSDLIAQDNSIPEKVNPIAVMSNLNYPAAFVSHFAALERAGYKLASGGGDLLIFRKDASGGIAQVRENALKIVQSIKSDINEIRNRVAAEEARSQPSNNTVKQQSKSAATVLDEIPVSAPSPTPEAPSTPSTPTATQINDANILNKKSDRKARRIRRQEQVFSGTIRPSAFTEESQSSSGSTDQSSLLQRLARAVRRAVLTTIALGVGAYTIGIVAEGIGAHAQAAQGVAGKPNEEGPRKKVIMPIGQRPGIFSTESSRND